MVMHTAGACLRMRGDRRRFRAILMLRSSNAAAEGNKQMEPRSKPGIDPLTGAASTIMSVLTGAWAARLVHTAAELGIADHLTDGPRAVDFLAAQIGAHTESLARFTTRPHS